MPIPSATSSMNVDNLCAKVNDYSSRQRYKIINGE